MPPGAPPPPPPPIWGARGGNGREARGRLFDEVRHEVCLREGSRAKPATGCGLRESPRILPNEIPRLPVSPSGPRRSPAPSPGERAARSGPGSGPPRGVRSRRPRGARPLRSGEPEPPPRPVLPAEGRRGRRRRTGRATRYRRRFPASNGVRAHRASSRRAVWSRSSNRAGAGLRTPADRETERGPGWRGEGVGSPPAEAAGNTGSAARRPRWRPASLRFTPETETGGGR